MAKKDKFNFKNFFNNSRDGLILADVKTKKFVEFNKTACKMLGYNAKEMKNLTVENIHPKEFVTQALKAFNSQAKIRPKLNKFFPVKRKDGKIFYADINTFLVSSDNGKKYLAGNFRDTTKRKLTEEKLKQKNSLLDSIVRSAADGLLVIDMKGKVEVYSEQFKKLWKIPQKIVETKDDKKLLKFVLSQLSNSEEFLSKVNYLYNHPEEESFDTIYFKDGRIFERYSVPQKSGVSILGRVWSFRDVTKEKELENAKNEFLFLASHQLRTPLSATKWIIELFMQDKDLSEKSKERLKNLYTSNERLIHLVNTLLDVTKIESGKLHIDKKFVNLNNLVENVCDACGSNAERNNQKIILNINEKTNDVNIDPLLFKEALCNLVSNSINYSPKDSIISISLTVQKDNYVVSVHNSGPEISEIEQKNLFDKFYRGQHAKDVKSDGSGLGLFITKKFIEINGGKIWLESKPGKGTTFSFTIPRK